MAKFSVGLDILNTLRTWTNLLRNLTFGDNFKGFEWEGTITAGEVMKITHNLKVTPTRFVITSSKGTCLVVQSATNKATAEFFYIENTASSSAFIGKVLILP